MHPEQGPTPSDLVGATGRHLGIAQPSPTFGSTAWAQTRAAPIAVNDSITISQEGIKLLDEAMAKQRSEAKTAVAPSASPAPE